VGVISSFPEWRAFFFLDELDRNVVRRWLDERSVSGSDRSAVQALIDICEFSGPHALLSCTIDLEDGFYALVSKRKGGPELSPVFCRGPFSDTEITFLAGAVVEQKMLKPRYVKAIAEENLETLLRDPRRRRREPIT
jgi:hypothetical protein